VIYQQAWEPCPPGMLAGTWQLVPGICPRPATADPSRYMYVERPIHSLAFSTTSLSLIVYLRLGHNSLDRR